MLEVNQIKVSPCRNNIVRLAKWAPKDFDDMQARWPKLRKVLVRFNAHHLPWYRCDGGETEVNVRHETYIDIPMTHSSRMMLVADLEAAGYNVIDEKEKTRHPYRDNHPYQESKMTIGDLRRIIKEVSSSGMIEEPLEKLRSIISSMHPNDVATTEYADSESGELYLCNGEMARQSPLHPQYAEDRAELANMRKKWAEEEDAAFELEEDDYIQLATDVTDYASNWTNFSDESDEKPDDIAHDAALGFFDDFPRWKNGSNDMSRSDILAWVVDEVYEAMIMVK